MFGARLVQIACSHTFGISLGIVVGDFVPRIEQQRLLRVNEQQTAVRRIMTDDRGVIDFCVTDEEK